jgi:acyl-CoA synthetase (AMP-forming)/AMP-acid ligase II
MPLNVSAVAKTAPIPPPRCVPQYDVADGPYVTEKGDGEGKIQFAKSGFAASPANGGMPVVTFPQMLERAAQRHGDKPALCVESPTPPLVNGRAPPSAPRDEWKTWTYKQFYDDARAVAKACIRFGHKQHDSAAIFGFNAPEWVIAQFGGMFAGGKSAGIYPSDTTQVLAFKVRHAKASMAFCQGSAEFNKFAQVVDDMPYLKVLVTWAFDAGVSSISRNDGSSVLVMSFDRFVLEGNKVEDSVLEERMALMKPTHCACLIYTRYVLSSEFETTIKHLIGISFSHCTTIPTFAKTWR